MSYDVASAILRQNREYRDLSDLAFSAGRRGAIRPAVAGGLPETARSVFVLAFAEDVTLSGKSVLLLFPDDREASTAAAALTERGVDALFYPSRDYNFNNITTSHETENDRLRVLNRLFEPDSAPAAVCAGIYGALQITVGREEFVSRTTVIRSADTVDTDALCLKLTENGYTRVELVEGPGQFAVRGGIVDVFPPLGRACRMELFGDEIDRLGYFDAVTQRFTDFSDSIVIPPAREVILTEEIREELTKLLLAQLKKLASMTDERSDRAGRIILSELARLREGMDPESSDKYIPVICRGEECLLDHFDGVVVLDGSFELKSRAEAAETLLAQSLAGLLETGELFTSFDTDRYVAGFGKVTEKSRTAFTVYASGLIGSAESAGIKNGVTFDFGARHVPSYKRNSELFFDDVRSFVRRGYTVGVLFATESERSDVSQKLVEEGITVYPFGGDELPATDGKRGIVVTAAGSLPGGFELAASRGVLLDFSGAGTVRRRLVSKKFKAMKDAAETILSYSDLEVGDLVVHAAYGIGMYRGIENLTVDGVSRDYVKLDYAGGDNLFLPVDQLDLVSKYIGAGADSGAVKLSKMGGADWNRARTKAKEATKEMAKELIELYARRRRTKGIAFEPDDEMSREFASTFEYEETDGQTRAIDDVRRDMEAPYPMDRLICGDVGYGKTEVALRAAFKAVMSGRQVAVLVPTTLLAYQHYKSFVTRLRAFPVSVDMLSRFRTRGEQQASLRKLRRGDTDIIIGTHRLISADVEFRDLGLVVVDEEQRFGVAQKEKLKKIAANADVLTLTATPIPRTLNMAMGGIVDMSILDEAPGQRSPVQTYVLEYDDVIIYEAIRRELRRDGQVFYLFNRVEGIYGVARRIQENIPEARIAVAHGKMDREELEEIWEAIIRGEVDVLVCTTIIETGVDIPNANTLIIENSDNYGLAQLHQIRGRVGRSGRRAYAYFTYRKNKELTEVAEKRLSAIKEYAEFGAGYKIALRDLEIRGAGNLLGAEQHGHMEAVGYDLYMKLLSEAVIEEKGEIVEKPAECAVDLRLDAYLPKSYIPSSPQRMEIYKKLARIGSEDDYEDMIDELCDRFGEPPTTAMNLCRIALIRALGANSGITKIDERDGAVRLFPAEPDPAAITRVADEYPRGTVRAVPGNPLSLICRVPRGMKTVDFVTGLLKKYAGARAADGEGEDL